MRLILLAGLAVLSGCASILEGSAQSIAINTNPAGADCMVSRAGEVIARVSPTPGTAAIKKTKYDIDIECQKFGYEPVQFTSKSDFATPFFGNILLGGPIGMGIDLASGAYNKYDAVVDVDFSTRSARAQNPSPREKAAAARENYSASAADYQPVSSDLSSPITSDHADRYQARREQLRRQ